MIWIYLFNGLDAVGGDFADVDDFTELKMNLLVDLDDFSVPEEAAQVNEPRRYPQQQWW